jgi:hypothetical protein
MRHRTLKEMNVLLLQELKENLPERNDFIKYHLTAYMDMELLKSILIK